MISFCMIAALGVVHKRHPHSRGFVQCEHFADTGGGGGFFRFGRPYIDAKIFRNIWCVRTNKGGRASADKLNLCGIFASAQNFSRFWADVFYGRPLRA